MPDSPQPPTPSPPRTRHARRGPTRFEKETAATGGKSAADLPGDPKVIGPWRIGKTIGKGASGRVKIAKHSKTGQYAAIKIVPKHALLMTSRMSITEAGAKHDKAVLGIEREIVIMKLIDHPNVMSLYDVWETAKELYLVLEYVEGGELFDYLVSQGRLAADEASRYFQQIIAGVDYCHRFNICHRDLKPENLLLDAEKNIKIADFGMAALEPSDKLLETSCGSPHYASPEIVAGMSYHGAASDIWSCGVILFALLTGRLPFDDENIRVLLQKVKNGRYAMPADLPADAKDLITRMLVVDPERRITMNEIMRHPFCQRRQDTDSGRRINLVEPPRLEEIARPVRSEREIDRDILRNLRTLWNGASEREIVKSLLSNEKTWEKAFYFLLLQYRNKHLENFNPDPESRRGTTERRRKVESGQSHGQKRSTRSSATTSNAGTVRKAVPREREREERDGNSHSHTHRDRERHRPTPTQAQAHSYGDENVAPATRPAPAPRSPATPTARVGGPRPHTDITHVKAISNTSTVAAVAVASAAASTSIRSNVSNDSTSGPRTPAPSHIHGDKQIPSTITPVDPRLPKITLQRPTPHNQTTGLGLMNMPSNNDNGNAISAIVPPSPSPASNNPALPLPLPLGNINVPQVQDAALQKFFHDIAEQLQLIGQASPRSSIVVDSPALSQGEYETITTPITPLMDLPAQLALISQQAQRPAPTRSSTAQPQTNVAGTRPDLGKRRSYLGDASNRDNVTANKYVQPQRFSIQQEKTRKTSLRDSTVESKRKSKPTPLDLSPKPMQMQMQTDNLLSPTNSPYLGTPPLGSSAPASPLLLGPSNEAKQSWFSNLFSWKPAMFTLISADDCASSRAECIKLLETFGASVVLEDADGWGVLKCRVDEIRDVSGIIIPKPVRFRIEFLPHSHSHSHSGWHGNGHGPPSPNPSILSSTGNGPSSPNPSIMSNGTVKTLSTSMTMVQERGALSSFKAVYGRLRAEWRLDSLKSPAISSHSRFTTSPLASPAMTHNTQLDQAQPIWS